MGVRLRHAATIALAVCGSAAVAGAQAQKMPPGSYLRQPVSSGSQIAKQISSDPLVAERYSRIFKLSPDTIGKAVSTLKLSKLKQDRVMRVYYVHSGERLGYKVRRVPKGTPVFVSTDGSPAMVQACGNPLRPDLNTGLTASIRGAVRKFNPAEPMSGTPASVDMSQTGPAPITDNEGRVLAETSPLQGSVLNMYEVQAAVAFVEDADAADQRVTTRVPAGTEDEYLNEWFHGSGSRLSVFTTPAPPAPTPGGSITTAGYASTGGTYVLPTGMPVVPGGPFVPTSTSIAYASTPEPGAATVLGAALLAASGAWFRRRKKA